jgi:hypothetical protein
MNLRLPNALRLPILGFAAALVLGSGVFYLALDARTAGKTRQLSAQTAADLAARDLRRTPERLARYRAQAATYAQLGAAGFLGAENRIDWLGSLARLRASLALQQIGWRLGPRAASPLCPGLHSSAMTLEIVPADPRRLEQFMAELRTQAHGHFTVRACTLQPDADGQSGAATCTLDWWTWNGE